MIGELVIVLVVAAGTLAIRSSMVSLLAGRRLSPALEAALSLVAPAALAGLVAQTLLLDAGAVRGIGSWHVAAAGAALVAWRTRSVTWSLAVGMSAVLIVGALG